MSRSSIANNARAALVKPLYIIFNLLILLNVHTYQTNAASSTRSGRNNMDNTTTDSLNSEQITLPSIVTEFLNRLQKNGVDDIAMIDLVFFGCVVLLGLEFVGHFVLKFCECKFLEQLYRLMNLFSSSCKRIKIEISFHSFGCRALLYLNFRFSK